MQLCKCFTINESISYVFYSSTANWRVLWVLPYVTFHLVALKSKISVAPFSQATNTSQPTVVNVVNAIELSWGSTFLSDYLNYVQFFVLGTFLTIIERTELYNRQRPKCGPKAWMNPQSGQKYFQNSLPIRQATHPTDAQQAWSAGWIITRTAEDLLNTLTLTKPVPEAFEF